MEKTAEFLAFAARLATPRGVKDNGQSRLTGL
jgi:hypothetical protein